jgi:Pvc16 N-terminal domain/Carboxypeptidase regulatory-like domain
MIRDLSETLRAILDDPALAAEFKELAAAQVVFDRPSESFNPAQTTIDLFLYDMRENIELRSNEPVIERNNGTATIHRPPLRVACSYLITAWPVGGTDLPLQEHRLLSQALEVLSRYPMIPAPFLIGKLIGQAPPLPMMASQADGLKNPAEFWTAIGNKLRPSLAVTVTISMQPFAPVTAKVVTEAEIRVGERTAPDKNAIASATLVDAFRIGGRVTDAKDAPVAQANVSIIETGLSAITNSDGLYSIGMLRAGTFTLRVESGSKVVNMSITVPAVAGKNFNVKLTG